MNEILIPITDLRTDGSELNRLVAEMDVFGMSIVESDAIKKHIKKFLNEMRDDLLVVKECGYVDRAYRNSYYDYYSTKLRPYNRNCVRLSFFDSGVDNDFLLDNSENTKNHYLGFLVLRPQQKCIGRNIISPLAMKVSQPILVCKARIDSSCYGIKLEAEGFPHASQDAETMTCAQTTIWMLMEYFGNKYSCYHPTVSSEIERILTPFVFERQLPSRGLTYNQVSVALREFGLGTKIYGLPQKYTTGQQAHFNELLACYIESGVPLAIALTGNGNGHAVVCEGREDIDKHDVVKRAQNFNGKTIYSWNDTVANSRFIFNDDNFPCYQSDFLLKPCERYKGLKRPDLAAMQICQFIAPLYNKVYMDADMAVSESKQMVTKMVPSIDGCVVRTLLTSSRTFREHIAHIGSFSDGQRKALLKIAMPKFIWLTEVSTPDQFFQNKVRAILLLDATGSPKSHASQNLVFMLADGVYHYYNAKSMKTESRNTSFAKVFECFAGNLKK